MAFRMGTQLHAKLIASAEANERSLSEEIERRLEDSYTEQERLIERFGGPENITILTTIASAWKIIEVSSKQKWTESSDVLEAMKVAAYNVMAMIKPVKDQDPAAHAASNGLESLGVPYKHKKLIENYGAYIAEFAVSIAKKMELSDNNMEKLVKYSIAFRDRHRNRD